MRVLLLCAVALSASSCRLLTQDGEPVTPQRPTFSTDTNTTAHGTLEIETGMLVDPGDITTTPTTIKYGAGPSTEVFVGLTPYQYLDVEGEDDEDGIGDTLLGMRFRILDERDGTPSFALMPFVKLPTANEDEGLGTGQVDFSLAAITSFTEAGTFFTGYYQFDVLGEVGGGTAIGHGLALAASRPVTDQVGVFGEVASTIVSEFDLEPVFGTVGATFALSDFFVLDGSVRVGLNDDAPDTQFQVGLTRNFGRVYRALRPQSE